MQVGGEPGEIEQVIRQWIQTGKLGQGQRIPTVRELADRFGVTRYAVHEAVKSLHKSGWAIREGRHYHAANPHKIDVEHLTVAGGAIVFLSEIAAVSGRNALSPGYDLMVEYAAMMQARGRHINVVSMDPNALGDISDDQLVNRLAGERPLGVITFHNTLFNEPSMDVLRGLRDRGIATVTYGNDPEFEECDTIESDHEAGAYALTSLLISRGCQRILPFMPVNLPTSRKPQWLLSRLRGYRRAMSDSGLGPMPELHCANMPCHISTREVYHDAVRAAGGYLIEFMNRPDPIDAVMAISDTFCFPLATACRELFHLDVGKDVLITGYDNYWQDSLLYEWEHTPPYATIDKDNVGIGTRMIEMIQERAGGEVTVGARHELMDVKLIETGEAGMYG